MTPAVSVLLPVRDAEPFLSEALESVSAQRFTDFEVIAVDDGSVDRSAEILHAHAGRDPRFRVFRQAPSGIVSALERARAEAAGRYLARMDADDVAEPERLGCQIELMERLFELVACGTHARYFPREPLTDGALRYERWLTAVADADHLDRELFVECPIAHPTFFMRAEAVEAVGGYRAVGWPEDYDLLLRLREAGRVGVVPEVLLRWRDRPDRLSRTGAEYSEDAFRRCKVHHLRRRYPHRPLLVWGAGPVGKAFARAMLDVGGTVEGFVDLDPRKIGQVIHGATVVSPEDVLQFEGVLCVAAVGQSGARQEIRDALAAMGWQELHDYVAVA